LSASSASLVQFGMAGNSDEPSYRISRFTETIRA
jgi:hypothetical protein